MLARPELRQLRQRIVLRHRLRTFTERETSHYVDERLRLAGYTGKALFDNSALRELFRVTGGVPRLINVVCDGALLLGYGRDRVTLDAACDPRGRARSGALRRARTPARRSKRRPTRSADSSPGCAGRLGEAEMGKVYDALKRAEEQRARRAQQASAVAEIPPASRPSEAGGSQRAARARRSAACCPASPRAAGRFRAPRRRAPSTSAASCCSSPSRSWRSSSALCARASTRSRAESPRSARWPSRARFRATARRSPRSGSRSCTRCSPGAASCSWTATCASRRSRRRSVCASTRASPRCSPTTASLEDAVVRVEGSELDVLPVRAIPQNPSELLASEGMRKLLETLSSRYDRVILDLPPTLGLPDAKTMSELLRRRDLRGAGRRHARAGDRLRTRRARPPPRARPRA